MGRVVDEKAIVNACVGLLATGGSTNHAIHLPAMARAAGVLLDWEDLDELSSAVPLIARVYPNGAGDVNHFQAAGGIGYVVRELLGAGLAQVFRVGAAEALGDFVAVAAAEVAESEHVAREFPSRWRRAAARVIAAVSGPNTFQQSERSRRGLGMGKGECYAVALSTVTLGESIALPLFGACTLPASRECPCSRWHG
jgi:phosphogluconate dehydratase